MYRYLLVLSLTLPFSGVLFAADEEAAACGGQPAEPAIIDGSTATMEELAANSQKVNSYIASADDFLDCSEARYKRLSSSKVHRDKLSEQIKEVTARRNEIGDEFNAQVAAFRDANPQ